MDLAGPRQESPPVGKTFSVTRRLLVIKSQFTYKDRDRRKGGLDPTGEAIGEVTKSYHHLPSRSTMHCDCCSVRGGKGLGKDGSVAMISRSQKDR